VLAYGNCAYRYRHLGRYEPGCPPLSGQVIIGLEALLPKAIRPTLCATTWDKEPIEEAIAAAVAAGYPGLECWAAHLERYAAAHGGPGGLAARLAEAGVEVSMVNTPMDLAGDPAGSLAAVRRTLALAAALGAPLICAYAGGGSGATAPVHAWRTVAAGLGALCDLAAAHGLTVALAIQAGQLHDSTANTLRLLRQTARPNLAVALDVYSLFEGGEEPVRAFQQLLPWVRAVQLKNARSTAAGKEPAPLAEGDLDYAPLLAALAAANYGGSLSVEWFCGGPVEAARDDLAYLRAALGERLEENAR
jgi:sugar phosphate isomerase/epimerase